MRLARDVVFGSRYSTDTGLAEFIDGQQEIPGLDEQTSAYEAPADNVIRAWEGAPNKEDDEESAKAQDSETQ